RPLALTRCHIPPAVASVAAMSVWASGIVVVVIAVMTLIASTKELFPKVVDGRDRLSGDSFSVDEHDAVDQVLQLLGSVQFPPATLGLPGELERHRQAGLA